MKKILVLLIVVFISITLSGCNNQSTTIATTTSTMVTITEEQTTTTEDTFEAIYSSTVESDLAIFAVTINYAEINININIIAVTVEVTAKVDIDQIIGTSSYGDLGIIGIRIVSVDNAEVELYSEFYDIPVTADEYAVHIDANGTLTRTIQFARMPFHGGAGGEQPSSIGLYEVQVALFTPEMIWIDTNIVIRVID